MWGGKGKSGTRQSGGAGVTSLTRAGEGRQEVSGRVTR